MPLVRITDAAAARVPGLTLAVRTFERVADPEPWVAGLAPALHRDLTLDNLKDHPTARAYRDLSWALGIDPTKRRPAGEALARRVLGQNPFPEIHPLVDAYNRASAVHLMPLSAMDVDVIQGDVAIDVARAGEPFHGIQKDPAPLRGDELVMRDAEGVIAVYLYRDSMRTRVRPETTEALVVACGAPGLKAGALREVMDTVATQAKPAGWGPLGPVVVQGPV